jgi:chemotaxis protein MotB
MQPRGPGEEWMLTYMDTVTLLVTLFVMILSFANFDEQRFAAFAEAMSLADRASGMGLGAMSRVIVSRPTMAVPELSPDLGKAEPAVAEPVSTSGAGEKLLSSLQGQIDRKGLGGAVRLHRRQGTVEMEINESVLFPLGSAELSPDGAELLSRLSDMLVAQPGDLVVEGHTDDLPIETERFPSNWELSGARAASVVRRLIAGGIAEKRLRIVGYAANRPLAPNDTPEDRRKNRRVNIILELPQ